MSEAAQEIKQTEDIWDRRFREEGHIWGDEPSATAETLIDELEPDSKIIEVGFGYGRDIIHMIDQGHRIKGIETSCVGLMEAVKQIQGNLRTANLEVGDFTTADLKQGGYDALYSHRVLHLLGNNGLTKAFITRAAGALRDGGLICIGARDPRDFNEEQMVRDEETGIVRYRDDIEILGDRRGQEISFWDEERFYREWSKKFNIISFTKGTEMESQKNPINTSFTIMLARKKSAEEVSKNGNGDNWKSVPVFDLNARP